MLSQGNGKPAGAQTHTYQPEAAPAAKRRHRKADSMPAPRTDSPAAKIDEAPNPPQVLFGENLSTDRLVAGLSQTSLAAQAGLKQGSMRISGVCSGYSRS